MKKLIYIFALVFGVAIVSCQKQDIHPLSNDNLVVPEWNANERTSGGAGDDGGSASGTITGGGTVDPDVSNGGITDPNNDPDGSKKGKGNK